MLTNEQIVKARLQLDPYCCAVGQTTDLRFIERLANCLQYVPEPLDGDLLERMRDCLWFNGEAPGNWRHLVSATLRVALDAALGPVTYEERKQHHDLDGFIPGVTETFLAARRARLTQPKEPTLQERVEQILGDWICLSKDEATRKQIATEIVAEFAKESR